MALIMEYVTIVSYSILVNGEPKGLIKPSRGLHQGDFVHFLCGGAECSSETSNGS